MTDWTVKGRVSNKFPIRTWSNPRGSGKIFTIVIIDQHGDEIEAKFFNEAADVFHDTIELGKVYLFANGMLKPANPKFSSVPHSHIITFGTNARITEVENDASITIAKFNVVQLSEV